MIRSRLKSIARRALGSAPADASAAPKAQKSTEAAHKAAPKAAAKASNGAAVSQAASKPSPPAKAAGLVVPTIGGASGGIGASAPAEVSAPAEAPAKPAGSSFANIAALAASGGLGKAAHADMASTDLSAYAARAKANGRDFKLAGAGMNTADDGLQFWGPVDNESSRARAAGLELQIDQIECISCGTCEENTNVVFHLPEGKDEEYKAAVLAQDGPMDLIQDAIEACPVTCISWEGTTDGQHPSILGLQPEVDAEAMEYYQRIAAAE